MKMENILYFLEQKLDNITITSYVISIQLATVALHRKGLNVWRFD
jgi:hypothetical protein